MTRANRRKPIGLVVAVAAALPHVGCGEASRVQTGQPSASVPAATRVEVVRPARHTVRLTVEQPGQVEAIQTTPIHARIAGYVRKVGVDIGSRVKKGEVLVELSVPEVEADLQERRAAVEQAAARRSQAEAASRVARAAIATAEAKVAEARAGLRRTDADLARWQQEYRRAEQLASERAATGTLVDETRSKLRSAEASGDEARAKVDSAGAALNEARSGLELARADVAAAASSVDVSAAAARRAEAMLSYARIEAPFDGVVTRRDVDDGHLTVPGGTVVPLLVVARTDVMTVAVDIPEAHAAEVEPGATMLVRIPATGGKPFEGKVARTAWSLESRSRTVRAEADFPNPDGRLRPGLYAHAAVVLAERRDVLTLPATTLFKEKDKTFCVAAVDGKAIRLPVETGLSDGTRTEILSGLTGLEAIVRANAASIVDGQALKVVELERPSLPTSKP